MKTTTAAKPKPSKATASEGTPFIENVPAQAGSLPDAKLIAHVRALRSRLGSGALQIEDAQRALRAATDLARPQILDRQPGRYFPDTPLETVWEDYTSRVGEERDYAKTIVQVVDAAACRAMLNHLRADAADPRFPGLCIDYDHFRHDREKSGRAAGWIAEAEGRTDGIYCAPRWSSGGRSSIDGGEYRSISPEFDPSTLESLGGNRYRVTRLVGFGLTNSPNMRGMAALTNRQGGGGLVDDGTTRAESVAKLARTLRAEDKTLSLHASYQRAENAVDERSHAGGALIIATRELGATISAQKAKVKAEDAQTQRVRRAAHDSARRAGLELPSTNDPRRLDGQKRLADLMRQAKAETPD